MENSKKYNIFGLESFESWDFEEFDTPVEDWLESNNFELEDGKWSTYSTFSIIVPENMISDGKLKVKFGTIGGNFELDGKELISLVNGPIKVMGDYEVNNTSIVNLDGLPEIIEGGLRIYKTNITNLDGLEKCSVGTYINVNNNKLTSIAGSPDAINGTFRCKNNQLNSLKGGPINIKGGFDCSNNIINTLDGAPRSVSGEINLDNNNIPNTEIQFYEDAENYNNYYEDLLNWIISNKTENDLDSINWPENFMKSRNNTIKSIKNFKKFNLGLSLD